MRLSSLGFESKRSYPIVIGGFYRSGTTLLRRLLDSHSRIHCGPEVKFFRDLFGDYFHDELDHIRFFRTARQLVHEDDLVRIFGHAFLDMHRHAAKRHHKKRWADKNPENLLYLQQWHMLLRGRFFFVHLVRHPLDTLASLTEIGFDKTVPKPFEDKVLMYERYILSGLEYTRKYPNRCFLIRYEDLVTHTKDVLTRFLEDIGEKFEASMLTDHLHEERCTGIEDPKALRHTAIDNQSIGRGIKELDDSQVAFAVDKLAPTFSEFGYEIEKRK